MIRLLPHRWTHEHFRRNDGDAQVVFCQPRNQRRPVRVFLQAGDADWIELTHEQYRTYGSRPPLDVTEVGNETE